MSENQRPSRPEHHRRRMTLRRAPLTNVELDLDRLDGAEAISFATQLTREAWSSSGHPWPRYERSETPYRFVRGLPARSILPTISATC